MSDIEQKLAELEKRVATLESAIQGKPVKQKREHKPTEYQIFAKDMFAKVKDDPKFAGLGKKEKLSAISKHVGEQWKLKKEVNS